MTNWQKKILQMVRRVDPDDPIQYVHDIVRDDARKKLDEAIQTCHACKISSVTKTITYGKSDASIMVLTDCALPEGNLYPLQDTEEWDILVKTFNFYSIDMSDCFFINAVNCCPFLEINGDVIYRVIPTLDEKDACKPYLLQAIRIVNPKLLLILGNVALNSLIKANVMSIHGKLLDVMGIPTIATFSPTYLIRCQEKDKDMYECEKNIFFSDFEKIKEEVDRIKEQTI